MRGKPGVLEFVKHLVKRRPRGLRAADPFLDGGGFVIVEVFAKEFLVFYCGVKDKGVGAVYYYREQEYRHCGGH